MSNNLTPRMTSMLTWLVGENRPVNIANVQTVNALIRRGLIEFVPNPVYGQPVVVTDAGRKVVAES